MSTEINLNLIKFWKIKLKSKNFSWILIDLFQFSPKVFLENKQIVICLKNMKRKLFGQQTNSDTKW